MRKKLKDKDSEVADCRREIDQRDHELVIKERIIAERDSVIDGLQQQISQLQTELQSSVDHLEIPQSDTDDTEVSN